MGLIVNISGGTASMCTDTGTTPVGATCHLPLNKVVWGDDNTSYKVNETYPLPVQIMEVTGESLVVTGNLGASGDFPIINSPGTTIVVSGSTSAEPVPVSGSITLGSDIGITGTVQTRTLDSSTDSITVSGSVGISAGTLNLNAGTDSVSAFGYDGGRFVHTSIFGADGTTVGVSGDAIKVAITNSGITFSANIASTVGITNSDASGAIRVEGISGGVPLVVKGRNGEAIEVTNTPSDAISVTGDFFVDGSQQTKISEIARPSTLIAGSVQLGGSAEQLISSNNLKSGIRIKSNPSNTDLIYIGLSGLTANPTNGYCLSSGESIFLECNNSNLIYGRNSVAGLTATINYIGS